MSSRKQPGVAFWATVVLVVALVAYPLSFGPACWIASWTGFGAQQVSIIDRPLTWAMLRNEGIATAMVFYSGVAAESTWHWKPIDTADGVELHWTDVFFIGRPTTIGPP